MKIIGLKVQFFYFSLLLVTTDIRTSFCFLGSMFIFDLLYLFIDCLVVEYQEKSDFEEA